VQRHDSAGTPGGCTATGTSLRRAGRLIAWVALTLPGCSSRGASQFQTAEHAPYPLVPTGGGPVLSTVPVVTVAFAGDSHTPDLTAFVDWLSQSTWPGLVASEYGVRGFEHQAHVDLTATAPPSVMDDDVQALLAAQLGAGTLPSAPASGPPIVYVLFYPDGTTVMRASGNACTPEPGNGYHDTTRGAEPGVPYVVVPSCDPRFSADLSEVQGMELETARLLVDVATDPSPRDEPAFALTDESNPWTALGSEVGDLCWGRLVSEGPGYTLQRVWSNRAAGGGEEPCIPTPSGSVAFGISASPATLQTITVGAPLSFAITGWSLAPVADWSIQATSWAGEYAIETALDRDSLNNGQTATLTVTIPFPQTSGTYGAVLLRGFGPEDTAMWPVAFDVR
jgi:hypothetical protein